MFSCSAPGSWALRSGTLRRPLGGGRCPSIGRHGRNDLDACACRGAAAPRPHLRADHFVAMGIIAKSVPERLAATAQTVYGTLALGIASAVLTFESGYFYGWLGIRAFWAMAVLCAFALPLVSGIDTPLSRQEMSPTEA